MAVGTVAGTPGTKVAPSGWVAVASTLGPMRFDAFRVEGLHDNSTAATPTLCEAVTPVSGYHGNVRMLPCDVTARNVAAVQLWSVDPGTRRVEAGGNRGEQTSRTTVDAASEFNVHR